MATYLRNEVRNQMWRKGMVKDWYLKPKQRTALDFLRQTEDPFLEAARRYGKTTTVLGFILEEGAQRERLVIRWCEPWKNQCREIVMTEMEQIQRDIPDGDRWRWSGTDSFYWHPLTLSRLYLRGVNEDRGESARGNKAHIIVADELGSWREPKYILTEVLGPQLLTTNGKLIYTGTPPRNFTHHFYTLKDEARLMSRFIQRTIHDQEIAPWAAVEKAVARAGGWDSPAVRREYLCEKVVDKNFAIIPEWDDKYVVDVPRDDFFPFYLKYAGLDIGVRDLTVVLLAYYDFRLAKLVVLDEVVMNGPEMTTEKLAERSRAKETEHFGVKWECQTTDNKVRWRIIAPHTFRMRRVSDIDLLLVSDLSKLHGLYYEPTDKGELEEMVNEVRMWVGAGRVLIHPRCTLLIDTIRYALWDEDRKNWERSDTLGHFDALAALMYLLRNVDTRTNPIPLDFGKPAEDHFLAEEQKTRREAFKKMMNLR